MCALTVDHSSAGLIWSNNLSNWLKAGPVQLVVSLPPSLTPLMCSVYVVFSVKVPGLLSCCQYDKLFSYFVFCLVAV